MNREQWLTNAVEIIKQWPEWENTMPEYRVSCGWPSRSVRKTRGQCFDPLASEDGRIEIFISPLEDDPIEVLGILVHEMVHAVVGVDKGHRKDFIRQMKAVGLEGKPTATTVGASLTERLNSVVESLGTPYPHGSMKLNDKTKKQSTRMLKIECPDCNYTARTTAKWIEVGLPTCCCGATFEKV